MRLHPLGHAMHLVEAAGLRLLFDPLLDDRHHGGVFEVVPPRTLDVEALRPDFIFVSHRHPDHFDVPSLHRLAQLDPETVVITPDGLVARTASRLGFRTVRVVAPDTHVALDGAAFVTTPSLANDAPLGPEALEWGVAVATDGTVLWNQVDTVVPEVAPILDRFESVLDAKLSLALVRWCPLLEVEAALARNFGFPFAAYAALLEQARTIGSRGATIVPASAGARHATPWTAMNALVYPLDEAHFLHDLGDRKTLPSSMGRVIDVASGTDAGRSPLVEVHPFVDDRLFHPHAIPPVCDPNLEHRDEQAMKRAIDAWVRGALAPVCTGACELEVVFPRAVETWSIRDGAVTRGADPDWDVRNVVAASLLCDVLEGRRHFGDLLLSGALRAATRARVDPIFLYRAIPYATSVERAIEHEVRRCLS